MSNTKIVFLKIKFFKPQPHLNPKPKSNLIKKNLIYQIRFSFLFCRRVNNNKLNPKIASKTLINKKKIINSTLTFLKNKNIRKYKTNNSKLKRIEIKEKFFNKKLTITKINLNKRKILINKSNLFLVIL